MSGTVRGTWPARSRKSVTEQLEGGSASFLEGTLRSIAPGLPFQMPGQHPPATPDGVDHYNVVQHIQEPSLRAVTCAPLGRWARGLGGDRCGAMKNTMDGGKRLHFREECAVREHSRGTIAVLATVANSLRRWKGKKQRLAFPGFQTPCEK